MGGFRCGTCEERVTPNLLIVDAGVSYPLGPTAAIKQCPDCGEVLAGP